MTLTGISFLHGNGEMRALIRAHDWHASSLGMPEVWPQSFKTLVGFMLDSNFPMFLAWGRELNLVYNDAYSAILSHRHPHALGRALSAVWSELWEEVKPLVTRALTGEAVYLENLPLTLHRKGYAEAACFTFTYSPVRDETGLVQGICCTCIETTQQVRAQCQRTAEVGQLQDLFQQTPGFMALVQGPRHVYELANPAYLQLLGYRDVIGKSVREALPELEGQGYFEILDQVYASGEPFIGKSLPVRLQRQPNAPLDERLLDFIFQPVKDAAGQVAALFIQGIDVTEAVKATQALTENEARLRQLANTIPHLAWMANPDGFVHWYNDRWYAYTGMPTEAVQGWLWEEVFDPAYLPAMREKWKASLATGKPYEHTAPMRAASGVYRMFFITAAPLRDSSGNIIQWFGTNTDVTELQRAQEKLMAADRRKDDFLAMLAHELRNPLAPINTAAELLKLSGLDQERIQKTSEIITRQVGHMRKLLNDLLDVSKVTHRLVSLQEETLDLSAIVSEAIEQGQALINAKQQCLTTTLPKEPTYVKGDRTRLTQVLTNVLNNAAKYTPEKGSISIRLRAHHGKAEIAVQDSGQGVAAELLPHIFDLFTQGERSADRIHGGLGLGLALAKNLVELHGGTVLAKSAGCGLGSEFCISLPLLAGASIQAPKTDCPIPSLPSGAARRILIVDDNVDAAQTLAMLLENLGHAVSIAYAPHQAIQTAQRIQPEWVFLDIGLPEIDGYELAARLRALPQAAHAKLIAVSGYGQSKDRQRAMQAGLDHYLVKPVSLASLLQLMGENIPSGAIRV